MLGFVEHDRENRPEPLRPNFRRRRLLQKVLVPLADEEHLLVFLVLNFVNMRASLFLTLLRIRIAIGGKLRVLLSDIYLHYLLYFVGGPFELVSDPFGAR